MKQLIFLFILVLALAGCTNPKGPIGGDSPEHLRTLFLAYHKDKDMDNMMRLFNMESVTKEIVNLQKRQLKTMFDMALQGVQIEPMDQAARAHFNSEIKTHGQTIGYNTYVDGQLTANYAGNRAEALLFGKKDERYYFALHIYK